MVQAVRENLRIAQSRQKSYADGKRRDLTFSVGDYVYLKVSPMRGIRRFNVKGKLAPRYVGPFTPAANGSSQHFLSDPASSIPTESPPGGRPTRHPDLADGSGICQDVGRRVVECSQQASSTSSSAMGAVTP